VDASGENNADLTGQIGQIKPLRKMAKERRKMALQQSKKESNM